MRMLSERLQILLSPEQKRRLEAEARTRGVSVGGLVREAIDGVLGGPTADDRARALERTRARRVAFVAPEKLDEILDDARNDRWERLVQDGRGG